MISLLSLASVLAAGTVVESLYGMRAAHLLVYGSWWFGGVLFLLGSNVLCAALSRFPWKGSQAGFVVTHAGILIILFGSLLTQGFGVDGNLPVVEGQSESEVILPEPVLTLFEENSSKRKDLPVPESAVESQGSLMEIRFGSGEKLLVDRYIPRASVERAIVKSPMEGIGKPALRVELFNDRFRLEEWLMSEHPRKPSELNLGPAILSVQKLWSAEEERAFLTSVENKRAASKGFLVMEYEGKEFRVPIESALQRWKGVGISAIEIRIDRYLPHAVVESNRLVTKSNEPINPAVELQARNLQGQVEMHTVFANFPQFATVHGAQESNRVLGLKFRMVAASSPIEDLAIVGSKRGHLAFAQSSDNRRLLYKVLGRAGSVNSRGEVSLGRTERTGWMNLSFRVSEWIPASVAEDRPRSIEYVSGGESQYPSGIHFRQLSHSREVLSTPSHSGVWLIEGGTRSIDLKDRRVFLHYGRKKLSLPFSIHLQKFTVGMDPGTSKAATYESVVQVKDPEAGTEKKATVSMNEPLKYGGYTFYQASYQLEEGRAPVSIFAVNYDLGRPFKYAGAICMVLGILLMFYLNPHYLDKLFGKRRVL